MKKSIILIVSILVFLLTPLVTQAAVPQNTIIIGNKAFDVLYVVSGTHDAEIQGALDSLTDPMNQVFFRLEGEAKWSNLFDDNKSYSDEELGGNISSVTYYAADGKTQSITVSETASDELTVISIE